MEKTLNSLVKVRLESLNRESVSFLDGKLDLVHADMNGEKAHATTFGIVETIPSSMGDIHNHGFDSEVNIKVGDKVWFDRIVTAEHGRLAQRGNKPFNEFIYKDDEGTYALVPFRAIYMGEREGERFSCNDCIIGTLVDRPKHELEIESTPYFDRILVTHSPAKWVNYRHGNIHPIKVNVGEVVIASQPLVIPINDAYDKEKLHRLKLRQIVAKG